MLDRREALDGSAGTGGGAMEPVRCTGGVGIAGAVVDELEPRA